MISRINHRSNFGPIVGYALKTAKRPEIVGTALCATDTLGIIRGFEGLSRLNTRCKLPVAHLVLSLARGEHLSAAQWAEVCACVAKEFGAVQWVAAKHNDTDCEHVHLIMSRVRPDRKTWSTSNERLRMRTLSAVRSPLRRRRAESFSTPFGPRLEEWCWLA